jgi:hypothetical protein
MWGDEVLEKVREARTSLAARFGFDLEAILADLRQREASSDHQVILPPKSLGESAASPRPQLPDSAKSDSLVI